MLTWRSFRYKWKRGINILGVKGYQTFFGTFWQKSDASENEPVRATSLNFMTFNHCDVTVSSLVFCSLQRYEGNRANSHEQFSKNIGIVSSRTGDEFGGMFRRTPVDHSRLWG